jgi:hypothetical protein
MSSYEAIGLVFPKKALKCRDSTPPPRCLYACSASSDRVSRRRPSDGSRPARTNGCSASAATARGAATPPRSNSASSPGSLKTTSRQPTSRRRRWPTRLHLSQLRPRSFRALGRLPWLKRRQRLGFARRLGNGRDRRLHLLNQRRRRTELARVRTLPATPARRRRRSPPGAGQRMIAKLITVEHRVDTHRRRFALRLISPP